LNTKDTYISQHLAEIQENKDADVAIGARESLGLFGSGQEGGAAVEETKQ